MLNLLFSENVTSLEMRILERLYNEYCSLDIEEQDTMYPWNFNGLKDTLEYLRERDLIKSVIKYDMIKYEITYSGIEYYENILSNKLEIY